MNEIALIASAAALAFGLATGFKPNVPLFYQIAVFAFASYFLGTLYSVLYAHLMPGGSPFQVGYIGYLGAFLFLFSACYGALDSLVDARERSLRPYRAAALVPAAAVAVAAGAVAALGGFDEGSLVRAVVLLPAAAAAYFACKHLIIPDVDMGIVQVMRPYNVVVLAFCLLQPLALTVGLDGGAAGVAISLANAALVCAALPLARRGVRKWFT